jgi:hypothetical protein
MLYIGKYGNWLMELDMAVDYDCTYVCGIINIAAMRSLEFMCVVMNSIIPSSILQNENIPPWYVGVHISLCPIEVVLCCLK